MTVEGVEPPARSGFAFAEAATAANAATAPRVTVARGQAFGSDGNFLFSQPARRKGRSEQQPLISVEIFGALLSLVLNVSLVAIVLMSALSAAPHTSYEAFGSYVVPIEAPAPAYNFVAACKPDRKLACGG